MRTIVLSALVSAAIPGVALPARPTAVPSSFGQLYGELELEIANSQRRACPKPAHSGFTPDRRACGDETPDHGDHQLPHVDS
jgi:hypothetical protein